MKKLPLKSMIGILLAMSVLCTAAGCGAQEAAPSQEGSVPSSSQASSEAPAEEPLPLMEPLNQETYADAFAPTNGYMLVQKDVETGREVGYVDMEGNYIAAYQLPADQPAAMEISQAIQNRRELWVSEEGLYPAPDETFTKWGFRHIQTGEFMIEPQFSLVGPFSCGRAVCIKDGMTQIIDPVGTVITTVAQAFGGVYKEDRLIVTVTGETVSTTDSVTGNKSSSYMVEVIDTYGNVVMKDFASPVTDSVNNYGFFDTTQSAIVDDPIFPCIYMMGGSLSGLHGFFDLDGSLLFDRSDEFPTYAEPQGGFVRVRNSDKFVWYEFKTGNLYDLNEKGYPCWGVVPDNAMSWGVVGENLLWYGTSDKLYGLMDPEGNHITEPIYTDIKWGLYAVPDGTIQAANEEGLYGLIDRDGNVVLPFQFEDLTFYSTSENPTDRRIGKYKEGDLYGLISADGMHLTPAIYESVTYPVDGIASVCLASEQNGETVRSYSFLKFNLQ